MASTTTTLSTAVAIDATTIKVASATGFAKGKAIFLNGELLEQSADAAAASPTIIPVLRGQSGTVNAAHPVTSQVVVGDAYSDFPNMGVASSSASPVPVQANMPRYAYSAAGALSPVQGIHVLNGTAALAMTLANPTDLMDGQLMFIVGNGKAAHTVTYAAGFGDASTNYTVGTYPTGGQACLPLIACGAIWVPLASPFAGTVTAIDISIA
jgi:hypothetical protein